MQTVLEKSYITYVINALAIFKVARRLVAWVDHPGHSALHFRKYRRSLPEDPAESGRSQSSCSGAQQIRRQYQGRARIGTAGVNLRHVANV